MKMNLKCAVIGAGITGASAALSLLKRGADVTLFEQFELLHERGSSHGPTRLFRIAYFEHPDYVPILRDALVKWRELDAEADEPLFVQSGLVMLGKSNSALISGARRASTEYEALIEDQSSKKVRELFPYLHQPSGFEAIYERDAGYLFSDRILKHLQQQIKALGGNIRPNTLITDWEASEKNVSIVSNATRQRFDRLIIAPGAWANALLKLNHASVQPMRKTLFWVAPGTNEFTGENGFLPFAVEREDGRFFYGFPAVDGDGVKTGEHTGGTPLTSPLDDVPPAAHETTDIQSFLRDYLPSAPREITKVAHCLYEKSADGHFIIDTHPEDERVSFAAGLSGHGFKFGPVIGEALADIAINGETKPEFDFLGLKRFSN